MASAGGHLADVRGFGWLGALQGQRHLRWQRQTAAEYNQAEPSAPEMTGEGYLLVQGSFCMDFLLTSIVIPDGALRQVCVTNHCAAAAHLLHWHRDNFRLRAI